MNQGDEILERQNDGHVIALLAAQRQLYSDAKKWHLANGFAVIGIPVAISLLPKAPAFVQVGSIAVAVILSRIFVGRAEARQAEGTRVQQLVDSILFDVKLPNTDHDEELAASRVRAYIRRSGTQGLKDWFPSRIRDLKPGHAEYACQDVNVRWTRRLVTVTFFIDLMIALLGMYLEIRGIQASGEGSWMYLLLAPIIEWVTEAGLDRWKLYHAVAYIKKAMGGPEGYDEERVMRTQESIYAYRCLRPVPDFVYRLTRRREQRKADNRL